MILIFYLIINFKKTFIFLWKFKWQLNSLDTQITEILLAGKQKCAKKRISKQAWSPESQKVARTCSYWKQKQIMVNKKIIHNGHLDQLHLNTYVSDFDHLSLDPIYTKEQLRIYKRKWKALKKRSTTLRERFLEERAELLSLKLRTT